MKEDLTIKNHETRQVSCNLHHLVISIEAIQATEQPKEPDQIHDDHVVGEDVGVARRSEGALPPPSLVAQVEDEDAEGQGEDGSHSSDGNGEVHSESRGGARERRIAGVGG